MDGTLSDSSASLEDITIDLPGLPHTFVQAMELSKNADEITIDAVVDIIQNDPIATTRILSIVNSTYYAMRYEVTTIRKAVIVLGPGTVISVLMSMSLIDLRTALDASLPIPFIDLVRHSIATAFLARQVSSISILAKMETEEDDIMNSAFTLGLLHDFGKLVLIHNFPEKAVAIYNDIVPFTTKDEELLEREKAAFGFDHTQMGAYMMRQLKMPESLCKLIEAHHSLQPPDDMSHPMRIMHGVLKLSNRLASNLGYKYNRDVGSGSLYEDPLVDLLLEEKVFEVTNKEALFDEIWNLKAVLKEYVEAVV